MSQGTGVCPAPLSSGPQGLLPGCHIPEVTMAGLYSGFHQTPAWGRRQP